MILTIAVAFFLGGLATWVLGLLFGYTEVQVIGAALVMAVGAMISMQGLEHKAGEIRTDTTANETTVEYQYEPVETPNRFPLGLITTLLGGALVIRALDPGWEV